MTLPDARPPLFIPADLANYLQRQVTEPGAVMAERIAAGWLASVGVVVTEAPVPEQVFVWAVELGGIAYDNPTGLAATQTGGTRDEYDRGRRERVLTAASAGGGASGGGGGPRGAFPDPLPWPDPAGF